MGKALVFKGVTIQNPITTVHFTGEYPEELMSYFYSIDSYLSDTQIAAIVAFYNTLDTNGLLADMLWCYPMFGNLEDAQYGIRGAKLTFRGDNASYNKGIKAAESYVLSPWENTTVNGAHSFYACTAKTITKSTQPMFMRMSNSYSDFVSNVRLFYLNSSGHIITFGRHADSVSNNDMGFCLCFCMSSGNEQIYRNGVQMYSGTSGVGDTIDKCKYFKIGSSSTSNSDYCNMFMAFNAKHTAEQVTIITNAVKALENALFDAGIE